MKNVLIACEESQIECIEFRKLGFNAYSCDIQKCSGDHPEWHILGDVTKILEPWRDENMFHIMFFTQDGNLHSVGKWDLIIAHPPCTYLSKAGSRWLYANKQLDYKRLNKGFEAKNFFMKFYNLSSEHLCIENPVPNLIFQLPKPDQIINPFDFGHHFSKKTCLWLKNLPPLFSTDIITDYEPYVSSSTKPGVSRKGGSSKVRSKSFRGIAVAMAEQWGNIIIGA